MVKRYEPHLKEVRGEDPTATMLEWINGDWVEFGDYDALAAELRLAESARDYNGDMLTKAQGRVREMEAALRKLVAACEHGHVSLALLDESKAVLTPAETFLSLSERVEQKIIDECFPAETPVEPADCGGCGGTGYVSTGIDEMPTERCKRCGGLGTVQKRCEHYWVAGVCKHCGAPWYRGNESAPKIGAKP